MGANNLVFTIQDGARVQESMKSNHNLGILVIDITEVHSNEACDVVVTGISTEFISEQWRQRMESWLSELRSYTLKDIAM